MPTTLQAAQIAYLVSVISPLVATNNPGASSDEVTAFSTQYATAYIMVILPCLKDSLNQPVTFNIPS